MRDVSDNVRAREREDGKGGVNVSGSGGLSNQLVSGVSGVCTSALLKANGEGVVGLDGFVGDKRAGPLSRASASRIMLCKRCS